MTLVGTKAYEGVWELMRVGESVEAVVGTCLVEEGSDSGWAQATPITGTRANMINKRCRHRVNPHVYIASWPWVAL